MVASQFDTDYTAARTTVHTCFRIVTTPIVHHTTVAHNSVDIALPAVGMLDYSAVRIVTAVERTMEHTPAGMPIDTVAAAVAVAQRTRVHIPAGMRAGKMTVVVAVAERLAPGCISIECNSVGTETPAVRMSVRIVAHTDSAAVGTFVRTTADTRSSVERMTVGRLACMELDAPVLVVAAVRA
jgi:hypothetical protein